jgi:hypothetical protein
VGDEAKRLRSRTPMSNASVLFGISEGQSRFRTASYPGDS